jgi:hypothetical protein
VIYPVLLLVASILPPGLDDWKRSDLGPAPQPAAAIAKEYGLEESESATYTVGTKSFKLAVHRVKDVTGAVALEQLLQDSGKVFRHQNYVFQTLEGTAPRGAIDAFLFPTLAKIDRSAIPMLARNLPGKDRIRGSERYILGPESLKAFENRVPAQAAGFIYQLEIQAAQYSVAGGSKAWLGLFAYPTPAIAKQQLSALQAALGSVSGSYLTRQGPVVVAVLPSEGSAPLSQEAAAALASRYEYRAEVVLEVPQPRAEPTVQDAAQMMVNIFKLAGILLTACLVGGLLFAGVFVFFRHKGKDGQDEVMTSLRL